LRAGLRFIVFYFNSTSFNKAQHMIFLHRRKPNVHLKIIYTMLCHCY